MPCYHPLPAWWSKRKNESGKRGITFRAADGFKDRPLEVPCGRCLGCRLEYSRQWAVRCMHEAKMHESSVFVTLTYDNEHLPVDAKGVETLRPRDYVLFMKRLRLTHAGVRFFQCGEYGDRLKRPHHHALLFNCWFSDRRYLKSRDGVELFTSAELDRLWGNGQCTFGAVSFESASYVARYTMKKVYGDESWYAGRVREYCTMSRRPGIGSGFVLKFRSDVYPSDQVVVRGVPCRPPRFYDVALESAVPSVHAAVKRARRVRALEEVRKQGGELEFAKRLKVREFVKEASVKLLAREVES